MQERRGASGWRWRDGITCGRSSTAPLQLDQVLCLTAGAV
jgi:hypothetical protein